MSKQTLTAHDQAWAQSMIDQHTTAQSYKPVTFHPLKGDAGSRSYFRLNTQPNLLLVKSPLKSSGNESAAYFARLSKALASQGIASPHIYACDEQNNRLLIEDFGNSDLLSVLNPQSVEGLYKQVLHTLAQLQQIPRNAVSIPNYSKDLLHQEMQLFIDWFVERLLAVRLSPQEKRSIHNAFEFLEKSALEQPQVFVHRDFHSRNIMVQGNNALGIIDFQDAVWGPMTYDLVSLLRDCYIQWPSNAVDQWSWSYAILADELGIIASTPKQTWKRWFDCMGLQRHIKVLGIFARLHLRDNKPRYLDDLPLVWHYLQSIAANHVQLQDFHQYCQHTLQAVVEQQAWYKPVV